MVGKKTKEEARELEVFELGVMRGLKGAQKAIEKEKEKLRKSWRKNK